MIGNIKFYRRKPKELRAIKSEDAREKILKERRNGRGSESVHDSVSRRMFYVNSGP